MTPAHNRNISGVTVYNGGPFQWGAIWLFRIEAIFVFLVVTAFYIALFGELPYHDVARFIDQIESDTFLWDAGHIFLQPVALLWHRHLGFGEPAETSLKLINTFASASGIAVFYFLLMRLGLPRWHRVAAAALVATSCGVITLAPSGHIKMLAFPFLNASILLLIIHEMYPSRPGNTGPLHLVPAAIMLALAGAFHASCLAATPFASLALLLISLRRRQGWRVAIGAALVFGGASVIAFALFFIVGYLAIIRGSLDVYALIESVTNKEELRPGFLSLKDSVGRLIFGTGNNFIAAPEVASVIRAWLVGFIPSLQTYAAAIAINIGPWVATSLLIATIYTRSVWRIVRGANGLVPLAFLCGATAWAFYYNLNDPEHWIALAVPTVTLFLIEFPMRVTRAIIFVWAIVTATVNLAVVGIPVATFPLHSGEAEIRTRYRPADLLVSFAAYPGTPYLGFFKLPEFREARLDLLFKGAGSKEAFFRDVGELFDKTLRDERKIVVFGVLDSDIWNAPWFDLTRKGLSKQALYEFLESHYVIVSMGKIGGLEAWEIRLRHPFPVEGHRP
jgi:hypothetical protein